MANIKISELEELTTVEDGDVLPIVDISSGETKKVKSNKFNQDYFNGNKPMGSIVVDDISCKNKFNKYGSLSDYRQYSSGTTTLESNGKIKATANIANGNGKGQIIQLKPNTTYTFSAKIDSVEVAGSTKFRILKVLGDDTAPDDGKVLEETPEAIAGKTYTYQFTTGETGKIWLTLNGINNNDYNIFKYVIYDNIQIEEGTDTTNYSEYKGIGYVDTGWHDLTLADNVSNLDATQYITAQCRRINNFVQIEGMLKVTAWNTKSMTSIAFIPENYRPKKMLHLLANNNDVAKTMIVNPSGLIAVFDGANEWVSIHCSYMID